MESYTQDGSAFAPPQIMNPPPQMFDYGPDDQYGGSYFADGDLPGGMEDSNDPKRRRIARV